MAPAEPHPASAPPRSKTLLCLVGFMGSGKTSVGRKLSQLLSATFIDLDRLIEAREGKTIGQIFAEEGEEAFRQVERSVATEVLIAQQSSPAEAVSVIAMGGGGFAQPDIAALLHAGSATTIFLDAPPEELYRRCVDSLDAGVRPLLKDLSSFKKLYTDRLPAYRQAQWHVDTSGRPVAEIAADIAVRVREAQREPQRANR